MNPVPTTEEPLLSVVVPTRHRPVELAHCLERLAPGAQTLPATRYEVLVSDDGDRPGAHALLAERFPWARWQPGPRRGPAANRNAGARAARGRWLAFTDDDCLPEPGWLAALAARIDAGTPVRVLEGRTTDGGLPCGPLETVPGNEDGGFLWSCNFAIERRFFLELGGFDEGFPSPHLEDVDLRLRLEDAGHRWEFVPAATVAHPPRPLTPLRPYTRSRESHFYLAAKRGISLAEAGLSWGAHWRPWGKSILASRSPGELGRVLLRVAGEAGGLCLMLPVWHWRYRHRWLSVAPAAAGRQGSPNP